MPKPWRGTMMDEVYMDMTKVTEALQEVEYDGCVIPDHIPEMSSPKCGENGGTQAGLGFSIGYMRAIANADLRLQNAVKHTRYKLGLYCQRS